MTRKTAENPAAVISFTVPLTPPSVNHYARHTRNGKHYVTAEAEAFKKAVMVFSRGAHIEAKAYEVAAFIYLGFGQRGDIDNFPKCILDGLRDASVIRTDAAVTRLVVDKDRDIKNPRTEITVKARLR